MKSKKTFKSTLKPKHTPQPTRKLVTAPNIIPNIKITQITPEILDLKKIIYIIGENHFKKYQTKLCINGLPSLVHKHYFIEGIDVLNAIRDYQITDISQITMLDNQLLSDFGLFVYTYGFICHSITNNSYETIKNNMKAMNGFILPQTDEHNWKEVALNRINDHISSIVTQLNVSNIDEIMTIIENAFSYCKLHNDSIEILNKVIPITESIRDDYSIKLIQEYDKIENNDEYVIIVGNRHVENLTNKLKMTYCIKHVTI